MYENRLAELKLNKRKMSKKKLRMNDLKKKLQKNPINLETYVRNQSINLYSNRL